MMKYGLRIYGRIRNVEISKSVQAGVLIAEVDVEVKESWTKMSDKGADDCVKSPILEHDRRVKEIIICAMTTLTTDTVATSLL